MVSVEHRVWWRRTIDGLPVWSIGLRILLIVLEISAVILFIKQEVTFFYAGF